MADHAYDIAPEIHVVEEFGSVYVIPPMQAPIRFNLSGSLIWRLATTTPGVDDVVAEYARHYECAPDEVAAEVRPFLDDMVRRGFLLAREVALP
jgi:hypothetical protein